MGLYLTLKYLAKHPVCKGRIWQAWQRYFRWQTLKYLHRDGIVMNYVGGTKLIGYRDTMLVSSCYYTGLPEYVDQSFLLHLLRADDFFVDVGANVGMFAIMAAGCVGAKCVAVEPSPRTFGYLKDNVAISRLEGLVECMNVGLADKKGILPFTANLDATNHIVTDRAAETGSIIEVAVERLDDVVAGRKPVAIKVDVEGFEQQVLAGGQRTLAEEGLLAVILENDTVGTAEGQEHTRRLVEEMGRHGFVMTTYNVATREIVMLEKPSVALRNIIFVRNLEDVRARLKGGGKYVIYGHEI